MSQATRARDLIRINDFILTVQLSSGSTWPSPASGVEPQLLRLTLQIEHDLRLVASRDDLAHSINYADVCASLSETGGRTYDALESFADHAFYLILSIYPGIHDLSFKVVQVKAPLPCKSIAIELGRSRNGRPTGHTKVYYEDLICYTIVGINQCEREEKQPVVFNVSVDIDNLSSASRLQSRELTRRLSTNLGNSAYLTLEALASYAALETLRHFSGADLFPPGAALSAVLASAVTVRAAKPSALSLARSAEVEITRTRADFPKEFSSFSGNSDMKSGVPGMHIVALALGSNLGDRFYNIELALRMLEEPLDKSVKDTEFAGQEAAASVIDTSFLYESAPMYVTDQPTFINCACLIETTLAPRSLLKLLKHIETSVGRVPSIRNGPRAVDLDILLYDNDVIDTRAENERNNLDKLSGELVVPHPRMPEREFVLRPLSDILPDFIHPVERKTIQTLLSELPVSGDAPMRKVIPFPRYPISAPAALSVPPTSTHWSFSAGTASAPVPAPRKTYIMATLNTTPDSFSDGSVHNTLPTALSYARDAVAAGATIIDIGGYSTRPGAAFVGAEEETGRVVPVIQAIRQSSALKGTSESQAQPGMQGDILISVDTFRWEVAHAAVLAGANCINDVYAFSGRESYPLTDSGRTHLAQMRSVARELAVPVVLMHSRGDAGQNKDYDAYTYAAGGKKVVEGVRIELGERVDAIVKGKGGVRRWLVIVDPGIGFSKTVEGNLELLRYASDVVVDVPTGSEGKQNPLKGFPLLIGASKKSFLGAILSAGPQGRTTQPHERGWATAAAVVSAVQQGALVVRVHDTQEMSDVVQIADAIWGS